MEDYRKYMGKAGVSASNVEESATVKSKNLATYSHFRQTRIYETFMK
jgi:hypothetical protein